MKWFSGSINEAVATSKSRKAVFVVFVAGDDDISRDIAKVIDTPEISTCLEKDEFVAIRLESGSESYRFFAQIYQLVPVPSLFFIGNNGSPLDVVAGEVNATTLKEKIDAVLTKAGKSPLDTSSNFIKAEQSSARVETPRESSNEGASTSQTHESSNVSMDKSPEVVSSPQVAQSSDESDLSIQEKVERARKLIELQKLQKIEKEKEDERQREVERREMGKQAQLARRRQQEIELAQAQEERMKEKAAEQAARDRVRQQIEQDKLERKHKELHLLKQAVQAQQDATNAPGPSAAFAGDSVARIQFKLPSGSPHMGKFEANSTLGELRAYVTSNIELPFKQFSLSTSFPRRDLVVEDDARTLMELELVPTAVILILPVKSSSSSAALVSSPDEGFLSRFVWALFAPILTVYKYIFGYFTGTPPRSTNGRSNDSAAAGGASSLVAHNTVGSSAATGRSTGGTSTTVRARGNIHRLHSGDDDNDENNTWNGNSTQQM